MLTVLLDTNIVSYLFKRNSRVALYAPHLLNRCNDDSRRTVAVGGVAELERAPYPATRAVYGAVHHLAGRYRAVSALGGRARDPESDGFADLAARCVDCSDCSSL